MTRGNNAASKNPWRPKPKQRLHNYVQAAPVRDEATLMIVSASTTTMTYMYVFIDLAYCQLAGR